ncbi:MAG TPA: hypothetical protein VD993_00145 [Chitinophagaceae bacterium]|nr:hypothetical protein [Chitinophagaceae bacterium]
MKRPVRVKIINPQEIRMGSPFNLCGIELEGLDEIELPKGNWQDKYAWSGDSIKLVLVRWNFERNDPGFSFFIIDTDTGNVKQSDRIMGLLRELEIIGSTIKYRKFLYDKSKSGHQALCCDIDEQYELL